MPESDDLPVADLAPSPLPYAQGIATGEMRWVVRFVALFMLAGLLEQAMRVLIYNGVALRGPITWQRLLEASLYVVVPLLAVGVLRLSFYALLAVVVLLAARPLMMLLYISQISSLHIVSVFFVAVGEAVLLLLICLRARRAGVLVPASRHEPAIAPTGDDVLLLVRIAGWFLLLPTVNILFWIVSGFSATLAQSPASAVYYIIAAALRVAVSVLLIRGRVTALLWMAGLFSVSLIAQVLQQIGSTNSFSYQRVLNSLMTSAIDITFCLVLYRRARLRAVA